MIYFDHSATTQPSLEVLETAQKVASEYFANPSSAHPAGELSRQLLIQSREQIAQLLNFSANEVFFASSGTEVNNWVLQSIVSELKKIHPSKNKLLISAMEHPSITNQIPILQAKGFEVIVLPVDQDGVIDLNYLKEQLDNEVLLISTIAVNNEVGSIQPFIEISQLLHQFPQVIWHVDGVQAITTQFDMLNNPRIDLFTLSSHKFHAIRGLGILAKRQRVENGVFLYGGGQESGLRSSTENLPAIAAGAKALRIAYENQELVKTKLSNYRQQIIEQLENNDWITFANEKASEHIICTALPPIPGEVLLNSFAQENILLSTSSACSSRRDSNHHSLKAMGIPTNISKSAIRISMSSTTSQTDVNELLKAIEKVTKQFSNK